MPTTDPNLAQTPIFPNPPILPNQIPVQTKMGQAWHIASEIVKWFGRIWLSCTSAIGSLVVIVFLIIIFSFISLSGKQAQSGKVLSGNGPEKIAVINLSGVIDVGSSPGSIFAGQSETITPDLVQNYIDRISDDSQVKAVIFHLNSPGGTIVASDQIRDKIDYLKISKKVKVIFLYGDVAASGGYYISSGADKIVANPATMTGSIGVIAEVLNVAGLYDKLGLKDEVYKTGANKDMLNPARPRTQGEVDIIQNLLNQALDQFVDRVAAGRNMDKTQVRKIADGRVYSGTDALKLGLVDDLGNIDKAIDVAKKEANLTDPIVVEYDNPSLLNSLFSGKLINPLSFLTNTQTQAADVKIKYLLNF